MIRPNARRDGLLSQEVGDELVVYDQRNHEAHRLNRAATLVWLHCDGKTSTEELGTIVEHEMQINRGSDFVHEALMQLEEAHLLEGQIGLSRSQKVVLVGAVALMLPVVETLIAPPASAAASFHGGF